MNEHGTYVYMTADEKRRRDRLTYALYGSVILFIVIAPGTRGIRRP